MNQWIAKILIIFTISAPMIMIALMGIWLLNEPSIMCLGNTIGGHGKFTSLIYIIAGLCLIMSVVYLFVYKAVHYKMTSLMSNDKIRGRSVTVTCFGLQLVLLILFASLYGLTQSTVGFASLKRWCGSLERWANTEQCLYRHNQVCDRFERKYGGDTYDQFLAKLLTPIESGCCKPPIKCNFKFTSPTNWMKLPNDTYSNSDCYEWENDSKKLCYNCQACKHGYTRELKKSWTISGVTIIIALLIFVSGFNLPNLLAKDHDELS